MNLILAAILAAVLSGAGGVWYGMDLGRDRLLAQQAKESKIVEDTRELARLGAADAIAANKPRNVTIKQEVQREILTNTVYADCRHTADQMRRINEAIVGGRTDDQAP